MRNIAIILFITLGVSCQNSSKKSATKELKSQGTPKFEFQEEFHNFGSLEAGEVVAFNFQFSNIGDGPLIIKNVKTECGCLVVNYPEKAISPGQSDFIEVVFNSAGETGNVYKEIEIYSNIENVIQKINIAATVKNEVLNLYSKN